MRNFRLLTLAVAGMALTTPALAQDDSKSTFQARYDELRAAMSGHDEARLSTLLTTDYQMTDINGQIRDRAAMLQGMERMRAESAPTASAPAAQRNGEGHTRTTEVLSATVSGDFAQVEQQLHGTGKRIGDDGQEHTMELILRSQDSWVRQGGGGAWMLKASVQKEMTVKMDGEEFLHQSK